MISNGPHSTAKGGHLHLNFAIGAPGHQVKVCKEIFGQAHKRGQTFINDVIKECKIGVVNSNSQFNVRTIISPDIISSLPNFVKQHGYTFSGEDMANAHMKDNPIVLSCLI